MKNINRYAPGLALGLGLLLSSVAFAQTISQTIQKKATDSCCALACCGHDAASMKDTKEQSSKRESCCSGDSCDMKVKDGQKNHAAEAGCCCSGDSCDMKIKDGAKNDVMGGSCCCCSGDSCEMKMKEGSQNHAAGAACCCCGGDSCEMDMKDMKHKEKTN
jgi:hypothetical protein